MKPAATASGRFLAVLGALLLAACLDDRLAGTTGVGNPPLASATFSLSAGTGAAAAAKAAVPDSGLPFFDAGGARFLLRSARARVGLVRLKLPEELGCPSALAGTCAAGEIKVEGPFTADLLAGSMDPEVPRFQAPPGEYRRASLRLRADRSDGSTGDTALGGHSLVLEGTFAYAGRSDRKFRLALDFEEEIRIETGVMTLETGRLNRMQARFDAAGWLAGVDLIGCLEDGRLALDAGGDLRIGEPHGCNGLEKAIKDGFAASGGLGHGP